MMGVEGAALNPAPPDPNVQIPAAVRKAADRANELAAQAKAAREANPGADAPVNIQQQQRNAPSGVTMAKFDPNNPQPPGESQLRIAPAPQQQQSPPSQVASFVNGPLQEGDSLEHQFKSLKGRYDRAEQDNKRLAGQIGDMQRLLAAINAPPPPQPQGQQGSGVRFSGPITGQQRPQFNAPKRLTEKEIADYGADLIDVMGRRAMEVQDSTLAPELFSIRNEIAAMRQQLGGVRQTVEFDAQTRMYQQLDREMGNWKDINSHPEFVRWLQMPDPLSGQIRHNLLSEAYNSQQSNRVLEFFRRFLADYGSSGAAPVLDGRGNGNGQSVGTVNLMDLAAPGHAKTGQTQVATDKPTFTTRDIKQFYTESANGKYVGREDEYNRIQQAIFEAGREGRIRSQ